MQVTWELERMEPRHGRGERIVLDPAERVYSVGRSERCAVRLYSASASRQHAEMLQSADGRWWVRAVEGHSVLADGEAVAGDCELCDGLSLEMGGDRLRCQRQRDESTHPGLDARVDSGRAKGVGLVAALIALSLLLVALGVFWLRH